MMPVKLHDRVNLGHKHLIDSYYDPKKLNLSLHMIIS
jgi:hypothetical protein